MFKDAGYTLKIYEIRDTMSCADKEKLSRNTLKNVQMEKESKFFVNIRSIQEHQGVQVRLPNIEKSLIIEVFKRSLSIFNT